MRFQTALPMQKIIYFFFLVFLATPIIGQTCSGSVGDNIFPDGDFGSGTANILPTDPQLAPGYRYRFSPPPDDGFYTIANNTNSWGSFAVDNWINIKDNSGDPNGYMMVVNASFEPGLFYEKTVSVCGNTNYEFSADVISMNDPTKGSNFINPNISFLINGVEKFSSGNVPVDTKWHSYGFTFTTDSAATEIKLAVRNNAPGGFGNDLALDNISFRPCGPSVMLIDTTGFCTNNREITLNSEVIGSAFATPVFQWQQSATGNGNWMDISNENGTNLNLFNPIDGQYFRLTVASSPPNLAQNTCRIASNNTRVTYQPERDTLRRTICLGDTIRISNQAFFQPGSTDVTGKAVNGCDSVGTVIIQVEDLSSFKIEGDPFLCKGDTMTLQAGDFAIYNWSTGTNNAILNITNPGIYGVTVTSINNCIGQDTILVMNAEITDFATTLLPPLCSYSSDGQVQILDVKGDLPPYSYSINGQTFQNDDQFNQLPVGNYNVVVQNAIGCKRTEMVTLNAPPVFKVDLGEAKAIELGDSVALSALSKARIVSYAWEPADRLSCTDCSHPVAQPLESTRFKLTVTNKNGCIAMDSIQFSVTKIAHFYAPTAFSPNDDGTNDVFQLFTGKGIKNIMEVQLFDRWGNLLFLAKNSENIIWDGTFKGKMMPQGVYVWAATVAYIDGSVARFSGDVSLIR